MEDESLASVNVVCSAVIYKNSKYLLVQEKLPKAYKKWNLPGGRVDKGESLEQALIREVKEETGLSIKPVKELFILHELVSVPVKHAYLVKIIGGELKYSKDEIMDAKWFAYEEIVNMKNQLRNEEYILGAVSKMQELV